MSHPLAVEPLGGLSEAVAIRRGIAHAAVAHSGNTPVHSIRTLRDSLDPVGFVDLPTSRYGEEYLTRSGDILLSLDNPGSRNTLLLDERMPTCTVTQQILILRVRDQLRVDPAFLFAWLGGPAFQGELARYSTGLAMPRVALDSVLRIGIPLPTLEEQQQIGGHVRQLEVAADTHRRAAAKIDQLRDLELMDMSRRLTSESTYAARHEGASS